MTGNPTTQPQPARAAALRTILADLLRRPSWFSRVNRASLRADAIAGLTGASLVLPQGVAFAAIAGLPPEYGFYTAMVPPVVAAFTGSSWHAISGPTTAISALVFGALAGLHAPGTPAYIAAAVALALMVGVVQLLLGLARMGVLIDFVSPSVMTGFVAGAALLIGLSQLHHVLGLDLPRPEHLGDFLTALSERITAVEPAILAIAATTLATCAALRRWRPRWPGYLIALVVATGLSLLLVRTGAEVPVVGPVDPAAPRFSLPAVGFGTIHDLGSAAVAIALIGLLEALAVARAIALRSGQPIDGNREITGQGMSNIFGGLFHCYPASASFTRSGVNYDAGAQTPLSAVFAALLLFVLLQFVSGWFALVPKAALGAVILLVAWRLVDLHHISHVISTSRSEAVIATVTFLATLLIDLEFSIYVGVFLSFLFFIRTTSRPNVSIGAPDPSRPRRMFRDVTPGLAECPQLVFVRIDGPLYFGSVEFVRRRFRQFERERPAQKTMLLVIKGIGEVDMPGADLLIEEAERRHARGGTFHVQTRTPRMIAKLARFKVMRALTRNAIHLSKGDAIAHIVPQLDRAICDRCTARIFLECPPPPPPAAPENFKNEYFNLEVLTR